MMETDNEPKEQPQTTTLPEAIRAMGKCQLFAEKESTQSAYEYALQLATAEGMPEGIMTIAIMVYHNSLVEALAKQLEEIVCTATTH